MEEDWYGEGVRGEAHLAAVRSGVSSAANRINHTLGGIIELSGTLLSTEAVLGRRIEAFRRADLDDLLARDSQEVIADACQALLVFRNRLDHDQWTVLQPRPNDPDEGVLGQGEQRQVYTTMRTLRTILEAFDGVADAVEDLYTDLLQRELGLLPSTDPSGYVSEAAKSVALVTHHLPSHWRWRTAE